MMEVDLSKVIGCEEAKLINKGLKLLGDGF
jgi:hypothetical protein